MIGMKKKGVSNVLIMVLIVVLALLSVIIFWDILFPLIKEATGQLEIETLKKSLEIEEAKTPVSIESETRGEECIPNWQCGEWSKCEVTYNLDDIIKEEVLLAGERVRECKDLNKCLSNKVEKEKCDTKVSVSVEKVVKCAEEYIEIRDGKGVLISRLELTNAKSQVLNVQFLLGEVEYCSYCYDNVKNYDEDEVDCVYGKDSCPSC